MVHTSKACFALLSVLAVRSVAADDKKGQATCDASAAKYGPQEGKKCFQVQVVLAPMNKAEFPMGGNECRVAQPWKVAGYNRNKDGQCPNGYFCTKQPNVVADALGLLGYPPTNDTNATTYTASTTNPVTARCYPCSTATGSLDKQEVYGNCKTTFFPSTDQYSELSLIDLGSQTPPQHAVFEFTKEWDTSFFIQMGHINQGMSVVRSPIVRYYNDDTMTLAVTDFYASLGFYKGFPRVIDWEQTASINKLCGGGEGSPMTGNLVKSGSTPRWDMGSTCHSESAGTSSGVSVCTDEKTYHAGTACGFNTFKAKFLKGKFDTFVQEGDAHDCDQLMCAASLKPAAGATIDAKSALPPRIYLTWAGTDKDDNNFVSKGLSYASFKQYSAVELAHEAVKVSQAKAECLKNYATNKKPC